MRRLYVQIYAVFVAAALLVALATAAIVHLTYESAGYSGHVHRLGQHLARELPSMEAPKAQQQQALEQLAGELRARMELFAPDGTPIATVGDPLPSPSPDTPDASWSRGNGVTVHLDDGRWLSAALPNEVAHQRLVRLLAIIIAIALAIAIGCYPIARGITSRLEALQRGVEGLGRGDLKARVDVVGMDEIAELARQFNAAADRIEALVDGQRRMLASASHELRSPLARLRLAVEMLGEPAPLAEVGRDALISGAERDVAELDELIDDLLLSSRLEARPIPRETVDFGAIVAEEAARTGARATGAAIVNGDPKALRRLVRNLLENARRYGGGNVEVAVTSGAAVRMEVLDRGPGVPDADRARIWEPFWRPNGHDEGEHGGVGLGLSLVAQIAHYHGGTAAYEPREGGGSRFVVELSRGTATA